MIIFCKHHISKVFSLSLFCYNFCCSVVAEFAVYVCDSIVRGEIMGIYKHY